MELVSLVSLRTCKNLNILHNGPVIFIRLNSSKSFLVFQIRIDLIINYLCIFEHVMWLLKNCNGIVTVFILQGSSLGG
jgi:hypothetical protein